MNMAEKYVIGIDLGGTNIKGALLGFQGNIIEKYEIATLANAGPEVVANRIVQVAKILIKDLGDRVAGLGIGVPGQPDQSTGSVIFAPNLRWRNVPLIPMLKPSLGFPMFLENDANAAALGEKWCGAGRDAVNMVAITIGTGIGGGVIINGRLYRGSSGSAGEIGHTVVLPDGPQCNCGNRGCLETLTAAPALLRQAQIAIDRGRTTSLATVENLAARDVFKAAENGDGVALEIIGEMTHYLSLGLANLINILNPDLIVVGGGVSRAGELLFRPLREKTLACALPSAAQAVKIVPAQLGNDAGSIGAGAVVLQELDLL
ncbi:ROK family glucokinase [bacterium]|nr:MAG: ROK family glucokinase [bacterium]